MEMTFFLEAQKVWSGISQKSNLKNIEFELELHKKLLDIFHVGKFYYYFFDIANARFQYLSPDIKTVLGYDAETTDLEFFMSKIHPDDRNTFLNHEATVADFFRKLPVEKFMKYKMSYDYRVIDAWGKTVRILQQVVTAQYDDQRNVLMTLGVHTDISHLKTSNVSKLSLIGLDGEPSYFDVVVKDVYKTSKPTFTKREKEILSYILQGEQSIAIANKLFISKFTVDTHRKNILAKTNTKNTIELAMKVLNDGLF